MNILLTTQDTRIGEICVANSFPCQEPNAPGGQRRDLFGGPLTYATVAVFCDVTL